MADSLIKAPGGFIPDPEKKDSVLINGVWVFNSVLTPSPYFTCEGLNVSFKSNGITFKAIFEDGGDNYNYILYCIATIEEHTGYADSLVVYDGSGWLLSDSFRTIDFGATEQEVPPQFYDWLVFNATQQVPGVPHNIVITESGTTTLATAGKYCDRNIDINTDKVYEAGQQSEYDRFWDSMVPRSEIGYSPYLFAGYGWKNSCFKPNKNLVFTSSASGVFRQSGIKNLKECLEQCGVTLDTSRATILSYAFAYGLLEYLPKISVVSAGNNLEYMCGETDTSNQLIWIDEVEVAETNTFNGSFNYCKKLEHAIFTGTIATNGLNLQWSTLLDKESLLSIINCLKDFGDQDGAVRSATLGPENLAKLTDAEKVIATQKGWTLV